MNILVDNSLYENLNKISLKKYEGDKYGFCKKIVNETINYENIMSLIQFWMILNQYVQMMKKKIN